MGRAILAVTDDRGRAYSLSVEWTKGFDVDARIDVPPQWRQRWAMASEMAQKGAGKTEHGYLRPYPTQPYRVHASQVAHSATGFYATAQIVFDKVRWRVPPPYQKAPTLPRGAIP